MKMPANVTCFKWHFSDDVMERYFYSDTLKECAERIKKTYRIQDSDFKIVSLQYRDERNNELIKEVMLGGQSVSLLW